MQKQWEVTAICFFQSFPSIWTVNIVRASKALCETLQRLMEKAYYSWNVFLGAPDILCKCYCLENMGYFCLSISRDVQTKRQSALAALLGTTTAVHKLFVRKTAEICLKAKIPDSLCHSLNVCLLRRDSFNINLQYTLNELGSLCAFTKKGVGIRTRTWKNSWLVWNWESLDLC